MATRLLEYKTEMSDSAQTLQATPWIPSGLLTASTQVKALPGYLARIDVRATDAGGDIDIRVWDTAVGATGATEVVLCQVTVITATAGAEFHWFCPLEPGVEAKLGIYVEVIAGDCEINVYYK